LFQSREKHALVDIPNTASIIKVIILHQLIYDKYINVELFKCRKKKTDLLEDNVFILPTTGSTNLT